MKKLFTLFLFSLLTIGQTWAQNNDTFQFVDKDGNVVASGTTLTVDQLIEDDIMGNNISTGLSVKNTSSASASLRISYKITTLDNGMFQICFPTSCVRKSSIGNFTTSSGSLDADAVSDLQCEWFPVAYGSCTVKLTIEVLNAFGTKTADGPTVIVFFNNADPAGIIGTHHISAAPQQYFSADGHKMNGPQKGLNIVRLTDGKIIKHLNK